MPARLFRLVVPVADIERATRFYAAVLEIPGMRVSPGRHYFTCGGTILACVDPRADGDDHAPVPLPDCVYFAVESLEATFEACAAAGAAPEPGEIHGDPAGRICRRPWGERSFYVRDPFGNPLCFVDHTTCYTG